MKEKYLPNKKYYDFSLDCECGVIVDEKTMKKIQKVLYKAETEIKNILHNADDVRCYTWSLVNIMQGDKIIKQKTFDYADFRGLWEKENRINKLKLTTPRYMEDFYEVHNEEELEDLKKCLLEELQKEQNENNVKE